MILPLYFVRSGNIALTRGVLSNYGLIGYLRSSVTGVYAAGTWGANAYYLRIDTWTVKSDSPDYRWLGFPVRCLVY